MFTFKNLTYSLTCLFPQPKNVAVVVTYHTISDSGVYNAVSPKMFKEQMKLLRKNKFNPVLLSELTRMINDGGLKPKTVCVTFDDGFMDNYTNAFPILKQYKIPATIFVETCHIGLESENQGEMFPMLGKGELIKLQDSNLVSIEPHTVHHPRLTKISENNMYHEVRQSKDYLERLLNKKCEHFAYPYGLHNKTVHQAVSRTGIRYAYTTEEGFVRLGDDTIELNRNSMNRTISLRQFESICLFGKFSQKRLFRAIGFTPLS